MPEWLTPLLGVVGTIALGALTWLATRRTGDRDRIEKLEARLDKVDGRQLKLQDYVGLLRKHINDGNPPPPPPYPTDFYD